MTCATQKALSEGRIVSDGTYLVSDGEVIDYAERWSYGYIVAVKSLSMLAEYPTQAWLTKYGEGLVGIWKDDLGVVYVDYVAHITDRDSALRVARARNELAIWSLRDNECIYL